MTRTMLHPRELLMGAITLAGISLAALASGCGGGSGGPTTPTSPATTSTVPPAGTPALVDAGPRAVGTQLYDGQAFAIAYPGGWWVQTGEQPTSFGTVTTIVDPAEPARSVRVEVRPRPVNAREVPRGVRNQAGYRQLGLRRISFEGHDALHWQYVIDRRGRPVRRDVLRFTDDGERGITIVTQAPAGQYRTWARAFAGTRSSYLPQ